MFVKIATQTPRVFLSVVRETVRSKSARLLECRAGNGRARLPRYIDLKMTNRCNLRCAMCGQWGKEGTYKNASRETLSDEMDLDELKGLVDEVAHFKPMFYLWGGEPFLHNDLIPFVEYLHRRKLLCAINTNGTFLSQTARDLVGTSIANILVSVDGPREIHDRVRGVPGTFEKVISGVQQLLEKREETGAKRPYVTFVTTVNKENVEAFPAVYDLASELGIDFVGLQFGTFTTEKTGTAYEARMKQALGCEATSWRGFLSYATDLNVEAVQEGLRQIKQSQYDFGTYFVPDISPEQLPEYYSNTRPINGHDKCVVPWMRADILPNGDVYPCIDFPDYIVGNVRQTPFSRLWNGDRYRAFRREVSEKLLPICGRCCALYQF